jgi:hypothetical protein
MVISDAEKKILLERLAKAREVKAAKTAAAKKAPVPKKETPQPPAAPVMEPIPAPQEVEQLPAETAVALPPKAQEEEKQQKREKIDNSNDESDNEQSAKPVQKSSKTKKTKQTPYMKIKIFHEPKNHAALQNLIEAVQDNGVECDGCEEPPFPPPSTFEAPRLRHDIKNQAPKASKTLPSHQELMRRAALEFFG